MKKILALSLTLVLLLSVVCACNDEKETKKKPSTNSSSVSSTEDVSSVESEISSEEVTSDESTSSEEEVADKPVVNTSSTPEEEEKEEKPENEEPEAEEEEESTGYQILKTLQGGINFSGMDHGQSVKDKNIYIYDRSYYELIADAGFDHIRLPVGMGAHVISEGPDYLLDNESLRYLDVALDYALDAGLVIFLDNHHGSCYEDKEKFVRIWEQLAERYQYYPDELMFELVNEPNGLSDNHVNEVQMAAVEVIRKTNPTRILALAPNQWNGYYKIWDTQIPSTLNEKGQIEYDKNIVLSVHIYNDLDFTHQGAMSSDGKASHWRDSLAVSVTEALAACLDYEERTGRQCWISEWGAFQGGHRPGECDLGCMEKYYKHFTSECARMDLAYAVWEFNVGFGIYDNSKNQFYDYLFDNMIIKW